MYNVNTIFSFANKRKKDKCEINNYKHKVLISGSRSYKNYDQFKTLMEEAIIKFNLDRENTIFISGKANHGADRFIIDFCKENQWYWTEFPAEWENLTKEPVKIKINSQGKEYNALAGFNRNEEMVNACNLAIFFWDNKSPGTRDSITKIRNKQIKHLIYLINGEKNHGGKESEESGQ